MKLIGFRRKQRSARPRRSQRRQGGFTLIELLVASFLAVFLIVALTGMLRAVWQQGKAAQRAAAAFPATSLLETQIRRDFTNARYFQLLPNGIRLGGFLTTEPSTGAPTFRHAVVSYEILPARGHSRLVRVEGEISETPRPPRAELLWVGAQQVQLIKLAEALQAGPAPPTRYRGMVTLPADLQVVIRDSSGGILCSTRVANNRET